MSIMSTGCSGCSECSGLLLMGFLKKPCNANPLHSVHSVHSPPVLSPRRGKSGSALDWRTA